MAVSNMNMYFTLVFNFAFFNIISNLEFNCPSECSCSDFYSSVSERAEPKSAECRLNSVADVIKFPTLHPELQLFKSASGSEIESVNEDTFRATQQIEEILMNNSGLKEIGKESFSGFPNLRLVNLSGNEMELLSFEAFWKLESESVTVDLSGNPWHCDCKLKTELDRIFHVAFFDKTILTCASPPEFKGKPFHLIAEKDVCTNLEGAKIGNIIFLLVILLLAITFTIFCVCYYYCCLIREEELEKMFKPDSNVVKFYPKLQRQPSEENYEYEEGVQYDSLPKKPKKSPSFGDRSSMRSSFNSRNGSFNRPNYQPDDKRLSNPPNQTRPPLNSTSLSRKISRNSSASSFSRPRRDTNNDFSPSPMSPISPTSPQRVKYPNDRRNSSGRMRDQRRDISDFDDQSFV
ncbi:uncharacterized protein LOC142351591 [Convolutriloba macropyga]|uniref:uncharacterized protein LOC142351591 n=1 Tax=Convolutriloba macropyga TaxID=536237 RepID=UPI003F52662A